MTHCPSELASVGADAKAETTPTYESMCCSAGDSKRFEEYQQVTCWWQAECIAMADMSEAWQMKVNELY